jgi:hypothetical protein
VSREEVLLNAEAAVYDFPASVGALLDDFREFFRRFVVVGDVEADTVALWTAHTYVYDTSRATPYLHFWSPDPGSGKSTALEVLEITAREGTTVDDLTGAALFRFIEASRPTLLIDEVDGIFGKKNNDGSEDIRKVLNSGYRAGKRVIRMGGPRHDEIHTFDPYCPKALAGLRELPSTLAHRSIPIAMQPPRPDEHFEDFDPEEIEEQAHRLRKLLEAWAASATDTLRNPDLKPPKIPELDSRRNEIWRILFRVADLAGGDWPERARAAAIALSSGDRRNDEASAGIRLLGHIADVFKDEQISCAALVEALNGSDDMPYGGWNDGTGIKTRELGWKLKPYGIHANTIRTDEGKTPKGYRRTWFEDAWARYLPSSALTTATTATTGSQTQKQAEEQPTQPGLVSVVENAGNPHGNSDVAVVAVSDAELGEDALTELGLASLGELQERFS